MNLICIAKLLYFALQIYVRWKAGGHGGPTRGIPETLRVRSRGSLASAAIPASLTASLSICGLGPHVERQQESLVIRISLGAPGCGPRNGGETRAFDVGDERLP
jgi:hypothetical protein